MLEVGVPSSTSGSSSSDPRLLLSSWGGEVPGGRTGLLERGSLCQGYVAGRRVFKEEECDTSPWNSSEDLPHCPTLPRFIAL